MKTTLIAERYAKALFELAGQQQVLDDVYRDMEMLHSLAEENRELNLLLKSPIITPDKKQKILLTLFAKYLHKLSMAFILLMVRKRREEILKEIACNFIELYKTSKGIIMVELVTPVKVGDKTKKEVSQLVKKYSGFEVELTEKTDPDLIGGFVLKWKDKKYDASLRYQLNKFERAVALVNLYIKEI
jgi:F-type H+-transporting ATPase subunit delta